MDTLAIMRLIQFIISCISAIFVVSMVIAKLFTYIKVKHIEHKDMRDKKIEQKEKELLSDLLAKYGIKTISELKEVKKDEK